MPGIHKPQEARERIMVVNFHKMSIYALNGHSVLKKSTRLSPLHNEAPA